MRRLPVEDTVLEVSDRGAGEPVILVQTALTADELRPLAEQPALQSAFRTVLYHRRGYAGSGPVAGPGSIRRDAADCRALLRALDINTAHIVGVSFSAAVAMQLAADAPQHVRSLTLLEPPPVHVPSAPAFRAANARLLEVRRRHGPAVALDEILTAVVGPTWRADAERAVPGSGEQMRRDTATFVDVDLPALLSWQYTAADARRITCPVLHIGGSDSGPWFAEVRHLILAWFPHAEDVILPGADHSLALTHPTAIADALVAFLQRHPIRDGGHAQAASPPADVSRRHLDP